MTTLATNSPLAQEIGDFNTLPVIASDIIYDGAAVGENGAGYARPLVSGDRFRGFATRQADNSAGSAGDVDVQVRFRGLVPISVSGAVITDVGQPVYASDDATFTFNPTGGSFVGFVHRFVSSGAIILAFDAEGFADPYGAGSKRELVSANKTLDAEDTGKTFFVDTDAVVITVPATATALACRVVNIGAAAAVGLQLSPQAADKIAGPDLAGTDNKDLINTKATAKRGDFVRIQNGHADGPIVTDMRGTWATEG